MRYTIEASCISNIGRIRGNNEDNFYFCGRILPEINSGLKSPLTEEFPLRKEVCFAVMDGMGGAEKGQTASYLAASTFQELQTDLTKYAIHPKQFLRKSIHEMNEAICRQAREEAVHMGSTAVILEFSGSYVYLCNLGDSRAFRLRDNELLQLSEDHTDRQFLLENGITGRQPRLTQHLGIEESMMVIEPYIAKGNIKAEDRYLLCSDGLTDMLSNAEICSIIKERKSSEEVVEKLLEQALKQGGSDNITIIFIRVRSRKED